MTAQGPIDALRVAVGDGRPAVVAGVDDADDGLYQRPRDDQPAATS